MLKLLTRLKEIFQSEKGECTICFLERELVDFKCGNHHKFCKRCTNRWLKKTNSCPVCRKNKPMIYNYLIKSDISITTSRISPTICLHLWKNKKCINNKHKFIILHSRNNKFLNVTCSDCGIDQSVLYY